MAEPKVGDSQTSKWIVAIVLILLAIYLYFRR